MNPKKGRRSTLVTATLATNKNYITFKVRLQNVSNLPKMDISLKSNCLLSGVCCKRIFSFLKEAW